MKLFAVIGCPVSHSRSPELYEELFEKNGIDASFIRRTITAAEASSVRELTKDLSGFAVTMPLKRLILPYLDALAPSAACGAVNIVSREGDRLIGHNTDGDGLADVLIENGVELKGHRVLILGRGGAALSAAHALEGEGASVAFLVRALHQASPFDEILFDPASSRIDLSADVFINATPLGMENAPEFLSFEFLSDLNPSAVFDMVYKRTGETGLISAARERGILALDGSKMLRAQALRAFRIWFGMDP